MLLRLLISYVCLCLLLPIQYSFAQISIGDSRKAKIGKLHPERLELLSKTTTVFVLRQKDKRKEIAAILDKCWELTPYEIINYSQLDSFSHQPGYSFYTHTGHAVALTPGSYQDFFYSLLWMPDPSQLERRLLKQESLRTQDLWLFARSDLYPKGSISTQTFPLYYLQQDTGLFDRRILDFANGEHSIYNLYPGFLKNQLQLIQSHLTASQPRALHDDTIQPDLKKLRQQTILVPEHLLMAYAFQKGQKVYQARRRDPKELFVDYPYAYEVVPTQQLSDRILETNQDIYYLNYLRVGNHSILNVINGLTGDIIYTQIFKGGPIKGNLTTKHLAKLTRAINKQGI